MIKYIYSLNVKITYKMFGAMYLAHNIKSDIYYNYNTAKCRGIELIKNSIKEYKKYYKCTTKEAYNNSIIDFQIIKIYTKYMNIKNFQDLNNYYIENIFNINKKDLYDFIMSMCGTEYIQLDYNGYQGNKKFTNNFGEPICCSKSFEYNKKISFK